MFGIARSFFAVIAASASAAAAEYVETIAVDERKVSFLAAGDILEVTVTVTAAAAERVVSDIEPAVGIGTDYSWSEQESLNSSTII